MSILGALAVMASLAIPASGRPGKGGHHPKGGGSGESTASCPTTNPQPAVPSSGIYFGSWIDPDGRWTGNAAAENEVTTFESQIGRKVDIDHHYYAWTDTFPSGLEQWDLSNGRIPLVTWKGTTLDPIIAGEYDSMIRTRADAVRDLGQPVFLRWGWEMNGSWSAWGGAQNNDPGQTNGPTKFIHAWQRIHDIFEAECATNVAWVWAPNNEDSPSDAWNHWTNYWPGSQYVDWVGIDGFNWGTTQSWSNWRDLPEIIGPIYDDYASQKPIMVAETGSVEQGGSKSHWFTNARNALESTRFSNVRAFVYFHAPTDWPITTSATAASAFRAWAEDPYSHSGGSVQPRPGVAGAFVWPQPATKSAAIAFTVSGTPSVSVEIRNSSGVVVRHLVTGVAYGPGSYSVTWDRKDDAKRRLGNGTYTAVVSATDGSQSSQSFQAK